MSSSFVLVCTNVWNFLSLLYAQYMQCDCVCVYVRVYMYMCAYECECLTRAVFVVVCVHSVLIWLHITRHGMRLEFQIYYYFFLSFLLTSIENKRQIWFASNPNITDILNSLIIWHSITNILTNSFIFNVLTLHNSISNFYSLIFLCSSISGSRSSSGHRLLIIKMCWISIKNFQIIVHLAAWKQRISGK